MVIKKIGKRTWRLYSKTARRNLGTFHSLKSAQTHEKEIQYFKRRYK